MEFVLGGGLGVVRLLLLPVASANACADAGTEPSAQCRADRLIFTEPIAESVTDDCAESVADDYPELAANASSEYFADSSADAAANSTP